MRTPGLLILLTLAVACSSPSERATDPAWNGRLPQSRSLAGRDVEETESGPWTVRRLAASGVAEGSDRGMPEDARPAAKAALVDAPAEAMTADGVEMEREPEATLEGAVAATGAVAADPADRGGPGDPGGPASGGRQAGRPLRAGATDDNAHYDEFLAFLAEWSDREDTAAAFDFLDVRDRRFIRVMGKDGRPVPGVKVRVTDVAADRAVLAATTYGDGRVPFYPRLAGPGNVLASSDAPGRRYVVEYPGGRRSWDGAGDLEIVLAKTPDRSEPVRLDVVILLDTTGSMGDEIERIKDSLLAVTRRLRSLEREFDLRYGAVLYRDLGDDYVTMAHPFTGDLRAFDEALQSVQAGGGGDYAESVNQGLAEAVGRMDWRERAAKVVFLIGDAPPHMDYQGDVSYGESLKAALERGIRIHAVAASGLEEGSLGSLVFRQVAQFTRGKFIFIEYGGDVAASGAAHGVSGATKSNNLDDILFTQLREEVARYGRD